MHAGICAAGDAALHAGQDLLFFSWGTSHEDAEDAHPAAHHLQLNVRAVVHGVARVLPDGGPDGHLLLVDHLHSGGGGHRASGHHQARSGHGDGEQPSGGRARHDLGRRPSRPHQEHGAVQPDRGHVSTVQDGPAARSESPQPDGRAQFRVHGSGRGPRGKSAHGLAGVDAGPRGDLQDQPRQQPADERAGHRHLLGDHGPVAGQDGRTRRAIGQRLSVHQRVRHEDHQRRRLVSANTRKLSSKVEQWGPRNKASERATTTTAGFGGRPTAPFEPRWLSGTSPSASSSWWPARSWTCRTPAPWAASWAEPLHLHPRPPAGPGHRPGHLLQLGHPAHHHEVSPGELPRGPADRPLRAAGGRHHQHGRHGALRGRGGHLHRAGQRLRAGLWAAGHHQHHGHGRQHRRGRHPSGGPGYHGDRADLRGPSPRRHHADRGHRLDPGPISHHDQRAGRRLGGGYHRPLVSQGFPAGRRGKGKWRPAVSPQCSPEGHLVWAGGAVVRRHQRPAPRPARGVAYDARAHAQRWRGGGVGSARAHRLLQHLPGLRRNLSDLLPGCMRGGVKKGGKERGMACGHAVSASQLASDFPYRPSRTVPPVLPVSSLNLKSSSTDII
ncbi:solute carrier family 1 member 8a isoform X4 [Stigmatopora nigra]